VPGVGVAEYTKAASYLADAWGCTTVQVRQTGPGGVRLRALLTDPLLTPLDVDGRPEAVDLDVLRLGVDEYGQDAHIPIPETSGLTLGGLPGYGKTSLVGYAFVQLAPSPLVQFAVLDGKGGADYDDIARRAFLVCGDDLGEANKALARLHDLMCSRQHLIKAARGSANFWRTGPDALWPLVVVIVDESLVLITLTDFFLSLAIWGATTTVKVAG
jgi:DNA segregation ATPase FtsK/SpoIIIE, S-DNA-T family